MIRQRRNPFLMKTFPYMIVHKGKYDNTYWLIREEADVLTALTTYINMISDFYTDEDDDELDQFRKNTALLLVLRCSSKVVLTTNTRKCS